jgi:hypothetical protein
VCHFTVGIIRQLTKLADLAQPWLHLLGPH